MNFSLSAGMGFWGERLALKLTGRYSQDPYFDDDLGGIASLQINY
ncbi:MAG: hypothetical protein P8X55_05310 [Desulfosarcinaceae bacterium]